jgi:hypothetical protein
MLSAANLLTLEEAGFRFIVDSRVSKAPYDLTTYLQAVSMLAGLYATGTRKVSPSALVGFVPTKWAGYLGAAAESKGGRPRVVDDDKRRAILGRRTEGQSLREIARGV